MTVSQSTLVFLNLDILEEYTQMFCIMFFKLSLSDVFSWLDWGCRFLEKIPKRWSVLLIISYQRVCDINMCLLLFKDIGTGIPKLSHLPKVTQPGGSETGPFWTLCHFLNLKGRIIWWRWQKAPGVEAKGGRWGDFTPTLGPLTGADSPPAALPQGPVQSCLKLPLSGASRDEAPLQINLAFFDH